MLRAVSMSATRRLRCAVSSFAVSTAEAGFSVVRLERSKGGTWLNGLRLMMSAVSKMGAYYCLLLSRASKPKISSNFSLIT